MNIQQILKLLHENFDSSSIHWLEASKFSLKGSELHLSFLHPFIHDWFKAEVYASLERLLKETHPGIKLVIDKFNKFVFASRDAEHPSSTAVCSNSSGSPLDSSIEAERDYLADFIYNEKNTMALKAAQALSQKKIAENVPHLALFYGPSGSGKSHLLKAIYQKHKSHGFLKCGFFSAEKLLHDSAALFDLYTLSTVSPSLVIIDDLQDLANSPSALSLITALCDLALKSRPASSLQKTHYLWLVISLGAKNIHNALLSERLQSRLEQGLYFELQTADLDIRLRYVERVNREKNLGLNRAQLINIARQSNRLTDAAGLMRKVEFFITLQGQRPSSRELDKILADDSTLPSLDWQKVVEKVARHLNLKTEDILGSKRKPDYVLGRQIAMYIARNKLALSFQEIGKFFGGKDHSTVMHAVKKIQQLRNDDEDMHILLKELEK